MLFFFFHFINRAQTHHDFDEYQTQVLARLAEHYNSVGKYLKVEDLYKCDTRGREAVDEAIALFTRHGLVAMHTRASIEILPATLVAVEGTAYKKQPPSMQTDGSEGKPEDSVKPEPPALVKHLAWLLQKETWKSHPFHATAVAATLAAAAVPAIYGLLHCLEPDESFSQVAISKVRPASDQIVTVRPFSDTVVVALTWEVVVSNNSRDTSSSIIGYDIKQIAKKASNNCYLSHGSRRLLSTA